MESTGVHGYETVFGAAGRHIWSGLTIGIVFVWLVFLKVSFNLLDGCIKEKRPCIIACLSASVVTYLRRHVLSVQQKQTQGLYSFGVRTYIDCYVAPPFVANGASPSIRVGNYGIWREIVQVTTDV